MNYTEEAIDYCESTPLSGVLTAAEHPKDDKLAVIVLNAGLISRSGPLRMNVELARALADEGVSCFRLDLSRLGYSPSRDPAGDIIQDAVLDCKDTMDMLASRYGYERFVLAGLCSGAENAHAAALNDERVAGVIYLDGYAYHTPRSNLLRAWRGKVVHYAVRVIRPDYWVRWYNARFGKKDKPRQQTANAVIWEPNFISREDYEKQVRQLTERGTELFLVFAGYEMGYQYKNQFFDAFPSADRSRIAIEHFREADHIYFIREDREQLLRALVNWTSRLAA